MIAWEKKSAAEAYAAGRTSLNGNPLNQMIGLGKNNKIKAVKFYWPISGNYQILTDLRTDQLHEINETGS